MDTPTDRKPLRPSRHVGESDITNFILLSRARQSLNVPFIASGGFADGQGLAAALCLGACGVNMGTRFMCTVEAPIHENIKAEIVRAQETDTALVLRRWKNTTRLYRNKVTDEALRVEKESTSGEFAEIAPFVSGARGRQVFINGDPEYGVSAGLLPSVASSSCWKERMGASCADEISLLCNRSGRQARSLASSTTSRRAASSSRGSAGRLRTPSRRGCSSFLPSRANYRPNRRVRRQVRYDLM